MSGRSLQIFNMRSITRISYVHVCLLIQNFGFTPFIQLFMGAVGLVFAPLAPLVVVAAAIVFWMSSWVYKYQLMFVFVSKVESGGVSVFFFGFYVILNIVITAHLERSHQPITCLRFLNAIVDDPE